MAFSRVIMRLKRTLLCNKRVSKPNLDIGEPTDIRVIDVSDLLPGLTNAQRKQIREEASSGALRFQSLQSHPPMSFPSPNGSDAHLQSVVTGAVQCTRPSDTVIASSPYPSSELFPEAAPVARLDAAPNVLPTSVAPSPRTPHNEQSPTMMRMKSAWNSQRRYSSDSSGEEDIPHLPPSRKTHPKDETLRTESPHTPSLDEGSEIQDSMDVAKLQKDERGVGGETRAPGRAGEDEELEHDCDGDTVGNGFTAGEKKLLVAR